MSTDKCPRRFIDGLALPAGETQMVGMLEDEMYIYAILEELTTLEHRERQERAQMDRFVAEVTAGRPKVRDRFLSYSGGILILSKDDQVMSEST